MVVVHLDDTPPDPEVGMPRWFSRDDVVFFPHSMAQEPACRPSRGTTLTGLSATNHGVIFNGGTWHYPATGTIARTVRRAGVDHRVWGKVTNGFADGVESPKNARLPDFREVWGNRGGYSDPDIVANGQRIQLSGFDVDLGATKCAEWIAHTNGPFLFWLSVFAPHNTPNLDEAPPRYAGAHSSTPITRRPSFNPLDSDPAWQTQPPWVAEAKPTPFAAEGEGTTIESLDTYHRRAWESMMSVDDLIDTVEAALIAEGMNDRTAIVVVGDNSYTFGEHRTYAKESFYRECLEVHLSIRWPGVPGRVEPALVTLADVAVTAARTGGGAFTYPVDGVDMRPLIIDGIPVRTSAFIEGHPVRLNKRFFGVAQATPDGTDLAWKFARYADGAEHLIDCQGDPYELWNLAGDPVHAAKQTEMSDLLAALTPPGALPLDGPAPADDDG